MTFSIQNIKSSINKLGGVAKASRFYVRISGRRGTGSREYERHVEFMCHSASLPGISLQTDEALYKGYGNITKHPYATVFQDVNLSFIVDSSGEVYKYFHGWISNIVNFNDQKNVDNQTDGLNISHYNFPDEYSAITEIYHLDDREKQIVKYSLFRSYPLSVGDIQVAWENSNQIARLPVVMTFQSWSSEYIPSGTSDVSFDERAETTLRTNQPGTGAGNILPPTRPDDLSGTGTRLPPRRPGDLIYVPSPSNAPPGSGGENAGGQEGPRGLVIEVFPSGVEGGSP